MSYLSLLPNTVQLVLMAPDTMNRVTRSVVATEKARIEYTDKLFRMPQGEYIRSVACVFLTAKSVVRQEHLICFGGRDYSIIELRREQGATKLHHIEAWVR